MRCVKMNGAKSDASTSTDDVKDRPLCLFYFTHPFGVLSPEPPTITAAPPSVTRAFLNMEPISPFYWPGATAASTAAADDSYRSTSPSTVNYDLGDATVHHNPLNVVSVSRTRRCTGTVDLPRRDSSTLSSSLFASDVWFPSSGSSRVDFPRRAPYTRILPPLHLPSPKDLTDYTSDDIWPRKCLNKYSLPPIELPPGKVMLVRSKKREELSSVESVGSVKEVRCRRKLGVSKARRRRTGGRGGDVRRMVGCLMRRVIRGRGSSLQESRASPAPAPAPALHHALTTIREAWAEPTSLKDRCRVLSRMYARNSALEQENTPEQYSERESDASAMMTHTQLVELHPRPDASPGLMRRRYSVPETIMRKYTLAQQNSDSEECGAPDGGSPVARGAYPSPYPPRDTPRSAGESPRHLRRDRELMRKSALLRRMWARPPGPPARPPISPPPACSCETRSLNGSRDELRAEPRPARQRDEPRGAADAPRDGFESPPRRRTPTSSPSPSPHPAPASPDAAAPLARRLAYEDSDAFSTSVSTAKETPGSVELASSVECHFEGRMSGRDQSVENEDCILSPFPLARPYEVLEVVVSESASSSPPEGERLRLPLPPGPAAPRRPPRDMSLDEYVSRVLVESLNSLSDRLEGMTAGVGADRKLSVVEKEIKVRLQNAAVNTIVHLSPTSNNQIIFGNEELCDEEEDENDLYDAQLRGPPRDECNNPRAPDPPNDNNNASPSASPSPSPTPRPGAFDAVIQHDNVNRAVLQQIQKLFRDEMRHEHPESEARDDVGTVSHIEFSSVDAFLSGGAGADTISVITSDARSPVAGVRAGNYFRDVELALVPRRIAVPHSTSMEVNTSSSEDAEADALRSDATSLVDSLDDPHSPRCAPPRRRAPRAPARPAPRDRGAAFFVRMRDDAPQDERARVAECMPERIRQKLVRRHRTRQLRAECARQGKVRRLRDELERRRAAARARSDRALEEDAAALADALLDDIIAKVARDEYRTVRLERRPAAAAAAAGPAATGSLESVDRRPARPEPRPRADRECAASGRRRIDDRDERARRPERPRARAPRRIYQKSEIREGDECIEILEILEYSAASRSSPETTPTDDGAERARGRRSRIPVPVSAPPAGDRMRLTGGDGGAAPPLAELLLRVLAPPGPPEPRSRSNSLRFKRVFDMIPEERGGPGADSPSPAEEADGARRASAPSIASSPAPPPPAPPSPPAEARRQRSQTTMTSPSSRSAATSPWRAPPPPRPPPPREGSRERREPAKPERRSVPTQNERERREARADGDADRMRYRAEELLGRTYAEPDVFRRAAGGADRGRRGSGAESGGSSSSDRSGGSLLCSLAPRWLSAHARQRRRPRRAPPPHPHPAPRAPSPAGGWSVTVAGSCRAALPADVEMRLRFPHERREASSVRHQECACVACAGPPARPHAPAPAPALPPARPASRQDRLTLTMRKEAQDSSVLATKSMKKCSEQLPDLETYRASRTKVKSSVKTRRGYSLHCWLPDDEPAPIRVNKGLSVLGCAIIPELKPRVPTMSERDLTRVYTPRHFLRS